MSANKHKSEYEKSHRCCKTCGSVTYSQVPGVKNTRYICCSDRNKGIMGIENDANVDNIGSHCKSWREGKK